MRLPAGTKMLQIGGGAAAAERLRFWQFQGVRRRKSDGSGGRGGEAGSGDDGVRRGPMDGRRGGWQGGRNVGRWNEGFSGSWASCDVDAFYIGADRKSVV